MNELLTYYQHIEAIPQKAIARYQTDLASIEVKYEKDSNYSLRQKFIALFQLALMPLSQMWYIYERYNSENDLKDILEDPKWSAQGDFYRANEIFDILTACAPSYSRFILGKLSPNPLIQEQLIDSIDAEDKQKFVKLIKENACEINSVSGILRGIDSSTRSHNDEVFQLVQREEPYSLAHCLCHMLSTYPGEDGNFVDAHNSFIKWCIEKNEQPVEYIQEFLTRTEKITKLVYYLFRIDILTEKESAALTTIKSRAEVADYFKVWDEEYQVKK